MTMMSGEVERLRELQQLWWRWKESLQDLSVILYRESICEEAVSLGPSPSLEQEVILVSI